MVRMPRQKTRMGGFVTSRIQHGARGKNRKPGGEVCGGLFGREQIDRGDEESPANMGEKPLTCPRVADHKILRRIVAKNRWDAF